MDSARQSEICLCNMWRLIETFQMVLGLQILSLEFISCTFSSKSLAQEGLLNFILLFNFIKNLQNGIALKRPENVFIAEAYFKKQFFLEQDMT